MNVSSIMTRLVLMFICAVKLTVVIFITHFCYKEWDARMMCEMSCATNCPNLPYLFAGFKKVQQLLTSKETLVKYVVDYSNHVVD